MNTYN